jgi:hypothetical protein
MLVVVGFYLMVKTCRYTVNLLRLGGPIHLVQSCAKSALKLLKKNWLSYQKLPISTDIHYESRQISKCSSEFFSKNSQYFLSLQKLLKKSTLDYLSSFPFVIATCSLVKL